MGNFFAYLGARAKWAGRGNGGICGWVSLVIGAVLAALLLCFPKWTHQHISDTMNVVLVSLFPLLAGASVFLVRWAYSSYAVFKVERDKAIALEERMKSRIRVSCGKSVDKSVVSAGGEMWYRARLDLEGCTPVPDIEASVTELLEDGEKVLLQEYLTLTMYPGMMPAPYANTKTLNEGRPEFVDIIRVADGMAHFPLKFYPRAVDHHTLLKPKHTYRIIIAICSSPSNRTDMCTFEFQWTGDPDTSDIRLVSVTPPASLTP